MNRQGSNAPSGSRGVSNHTIKGRAACGAVLTMSERLSVARGFTILEVLMVVALALIVAAFAIPRTQKIMKSFQFRAAVTGLAGTIQSVRYQAVMKGYPFELIIRQDVGTYQIASKPTGTASFTNVGAPFPLETGATITLNPSNTTLQFNPNGTVQGAVNPPFDISMSDGTSTEDIIISGVGDVNTVP